MLDTLNFNRSEWICGYVCVFNIYLVWLWFVTPPKSRNAWKSFMINGLFVIGCVWMSIGVYLSICWRIHIKNKTKKCVPRDYYTNSIQFASASYKLYYKFYKFWTVLLMNEWMSWTLSFYSHSMRSRNFFFVCPIQGLFISIVVVYSIHLSFFLFLLFYFANWQNMKCHSI